METEEQHEQHEQPEEMVSVEDFCAAISGKDRRVELISGFHADQKRAGTSWATATEFRKRFDAFANKPVG